MNSSTTIRFVCFTILLLATRLLAAAQSGFTDPEACRRHRRKDALLQQNGYFVLRFLAEDTGKNLDHILDTILAALVHREKNRKC